LSCFPIVLEEDASLLVIVLDTNCVWWGERTEGVHHGSPHHQKNGNLNDANHASDSSQVFLSNVSI